MTKKYLNLTLFFFILCIVSFASPVFCQDTSAGKIVTTKGTVEVMPKGKSWATAVNGQVLVAGDTIRTGKDGWVAILLNDENMMQINKNSQFVIAWVGNKAAWFRSKSAGAGAATADDSSYKLDKGEVWVRSKNAGLKYGIQTTTAVAGVRGTDFAVKVGDDATTTITVMEGIVVAQNEKGSAEIFHGEQGITKPGMAPVKTMLLTPEDAVQWTLTIPALPEGQVSDDKDIQSAYSKIQEKDIKGAQEILLRVTAERPAVAEGWSLLALTYVMTNKKDEAVAAAQKGVEMNSSRTFGYIVQSYAFQASFDIDSAIGSLRKALAVDPNNVTVLVNLAKLEFGAGNTGEAYLLIEKASGLSPSNSEIQSLVGYILFAQMQTDRSVQAFKNAIELDPGNAEAHMGLAIALMRKGEKEKAFEEISTAVLLEPRRSLFITYWAKMLYQEKRLEQALDVLKFAGRVDPYDPTPELYSSMVYRDLNMPTEAVESLHKAIQMNDNKAVYRSKFLLDKDLAVKNVDLSNIYKQLGLSAWAQSKAVASAKSDYLNYAAHLFLGGSLQQQDDKAVPAAGEYLLARILMPANQNSFNTFNEYTTFFEQPTFGGTISGTAGNFDTASTELLTYGYIPSLNTAFGIGGLLSDTDGWRKEKTNYETLKSGVFYSKFDVTTNDSIMFVVSGLNYLQGDNVYPRYAYDNPANPYASSDSKLERFELGYNRQLTTNSNFLLYAAKVNYSVELKDHAEVNALPITDAYLNAHATQPYNQIQGQYIGKASRHQIIAGVNQYWGESTYSGSIDYYGGAVLLAQDIRDNETAPRQGSYYINDVWAVTNNVIIDAGLMYDDMKNTNAVSNTEWMVRRVSPRLGLSYAPTKTDTFRLGIFQYITPFFSSRIDPMDVAGIPLYRNTYEGSVTREADLVYEHEWQKGYIKANFFILRSTYENHLDQEELKDLNTSYDGVELTMNQLLWNGYGLVVRYRYTDLEDQNEPSADRVDQLASAAMTYVNKHGISLSGTETYRYENMKHGRSETILMTDLKVQYELPQKRGAVTLEARNIFDSHFNWVTDYFVFNGRIPRRELLASFSLNF